MKKFFFFLSFLPSLAFAGFTTDNLVATSTFTLRTSTMVINGTTYYWRAGNGTSGQFLTTDGAATPALTWGSASSSGGSPLEVFSNFDGTQSSPTLSISIGDSMLLSVTGSTANLNVDISSVTAGLITASSVSANYLTLSSASATYFPLLSSTTLLTTSSATATYLQISSAISNFLSLSSVTANYLTKSSASATYFNILSSTTLLTTSSATANYLTLSSASATYFQIASSNTFIQNRNTLQSGATFFVSSGTVAGPLSVNQLTSGQLTTTGIRTTTGTFTSLSPGVMHIVAGSSDVVTAKVSLSTEVIGLLPVANMTAPGADTNVIFNDGGVMNGDPGLLYFKAISTLYSLRQYALTDIGAYLGATVSFFDADASNFVAFKSPTALAGNTTYIVPATDGAVNSVFRTDGAGNITWANLKNTLKFNEVLNAEQAKTSSSNPCVISNSTAATIPSILCDASTDESVTWSTALTAYTTTTMNADIYYTMVSTASGAGSVFVVHNLSVMCASSTYTGNLDTENFGAVNASTVAVPGAIGRMGVARVTLSALGQGCNYGSMIIFKYNRDANAAADTASGDISLRKIWLYEP